MAEKVKKTTTKKMVEVTGISHTTLSKLRKDGVWDNNMTPEQINKAVIRYYVGAYQSNKGNMGKDVGGKDLGGKELSRKILNEKLRKETAQADLLELEVADKKGHYVDYEIVKKEMVSVVLSFKNKMESLGAKLSPVIIGLGDDYGAVKRCIDDGVCEALQECHQLDIEIDVDVDKND